MFNKKHHTNSAEALIDATTKTDEPYNFAAGIGTIVSSLTSAAAMIVYVATEAMLPVYILIGVAVAALVTSAVLRLVGNYKRNNEITDRMERYRKEEMDLANKQQQTPTKQPEVDEPKKENNKENNKENSPENNQPPAPPVQIGQFSPETNEEENRPFSVRPPLQLNQFSPETNEEENRPFSGRPPVEQDLGNEEPINQGGKNEKPIKLDLATLLGGLSAGNKKKEITNKANTGLLPEAQGRGIDE